MSSFAKPPSGASAGQLYNAFGKWYDFWAGSSLAGGRQVIGNAPLERLPLHVRAGSILPLGPDQEWSAQKFPDPVELRVYQGANGDFTLFEDEGNTYNYEKGAYTTFSLHWDDARGVPTIGERKSQFRGMLQSRTFRLVFVGQSHGTGIAPEDQPDRIVDYSGREVTVRP